MTSPTKLVAVLGSTGSIGTNTLEVIRASKGSFQVAGISGHNNTQLLLEQTKEHRPRKVVISNTDCVLNQEWDEVRNYTEVFQGEEFLEHLVTCSQVDIVVAAIVGSAGLKSTWAAVKAGKTVALANKETMVVAGKLIQDLATETGSSILPVDSEHSAIFQAMQAGKPKEIRKVILTASGGPFLRHSKEQLKQVTIEDALDHPNWDMGAKITIDSATMMNKALEIIEARWLFDLEPDQIQVVVHPQSIIHSMVEFTDGSVVAQLSPPDMKLPIQYALTYPNRGTQIAEAMDWSQTWDLRLEPPDFDRFPALRLGLEVASLGGTAGAVVNAANEVAVSRFLSGEIEFTEIVPTCRRALAEHQYHPNPTLEELLELDSRVRQEVTTWVQS